MMDDRKRLFGLGALLSLLLQLREETVRVLVLHIEFYALSREVCANPILPVSLGLLLRLFEDKFGDVAVEVVVSNGGCNRGAHLRSNKVGNNRRE